MKKYCTRCGQPFVAIGREVICPACKAQAAAETKRAAVLRAKRASWAGESVPVRISGRASAVIRAYGAAHNMPFAAALDDLLKSTDYYAGMQMAWEDITPYKSHRRDKHATETAQDEQDKPQDAPQDTPQDVASKPQAAKASKAKASTAKAKAKASK